MNQQTVAPIQSSTITLHQLVHRWCSPQVGNAVHIVGQYVFFPWNVVHALVAARDMRLGSFVAELLLYGQVLVDDTGVTIVANASETYGWISDSWPCT